jgi:hypothetical protein
MTPDNYLKRFKSPPITPMIRSNSPSRPSTRLDSSVFASSC